MVLAMINNVLMRKNLKQDNIEGENNVYTTLKVNSNIL